MNTIGLEPVKADNYELGLRAHPTDTSHYEVSLYYLSKEDDILSFRDPATGATQAVNAGETLHRGVEIGAGFRLAPHWDFDTPFSYAKHTYVDWVVKSGAVNADYSGNEMETAPRLIANTRFTHTPSVLRGGKSSLEWTRLGRYWMDPANTHEYAGHNLLNLRINYPFANQWEVYGSVINVADRRFAESASLSGTQEQFAPGMPRTFYLGVQYNWRVRTAADTAAAHPEIPAVVAM